VVDELYATNIGGYTVAVRGKRIWLHPCDPDRDGNLTITQALALAGALQACAGKARRADRRKVEP
jgi:nitrogenase subunit NifH